MDIKQLTKACMVGDIAKVEAILAEGEVDANNVDDGGCTPLYYAMMFNHPNIVSKLLATVDIKVDVTDSYGETGLHEACGNNNVECVKLFTKDKRCTPDVLNMRDNNGESAVMAAVKRGHLESVRAMAAVPGIDFSARNSEGLTMIDLARKHDHQQIVQFMEERNFV